MSEISRDMNTTSEMNTGPALFQYYTRGIAELLSRDNFAPSSLMTSRLVGAGNGSFRDKEVAKGDNGSNETTRPVGFGSLFCNAVGDGLSSYEKARLMTMLRQSVIALSQEVDEMLDPVFSMHRLRALLAPAKSCSEYHNSECEVKTENRAHKRLKVPSSFCPVKEPLNFSPVSCNLTGEGSLNEEKGVSDDLKVLLVNRGPMVVEKMEKHSAELSATLELMEEKLEELLDVVISSCRPMTLAEKHHLWRLVQKLPAQNLDRVVEIIQRGKPPEKRSSNDITIDLQHEDDSTVWRIYFYVKAVENARKLL